MDISYLPWGPALGSEDQTVIGLCFQPLKGGGGRGARSLKPEELGGGGSGGWASSWHPAASGKGHQVGTHLSAICGMM